MIDSNGPHEVSELITERRPPDSTAMNAGIELHDIRLSQSHSTTVNDRCHEQVFWKLYLSHALSAWNSRTFEFGAVLFLAHAFPGTLLYISAYALSRALSAMLFSSYIGAFVDRLNRLTAIKHSIGG
jgi:iron-regulated transporter 1